MSPREVALVRASFARVQPLAAYAGALFYGKLFERDPSLRSMFAGDLLVQGSRLMSMIAAAVALLDQPARLNLALGELGERHVGYGVIAAHYDTVGAALLDTLTAALGDGLEPEVREAWTAIYAHLASAMKAGVRSPVSWASRG